MAARYALQSFCFHNTATNLDEFVQQGSSRDSISDQAYLQTPASYWSTTPLTAPTQISQQLAAYLAAYPNT